MPELACLSFIDVADGSPSSIVEKLTRHRIWNVVMVGDSPRSDLSTALGAARITIDSITEPSDAARTLESFAHGRLAWLIDAPSETAQRLRSEARHFLQSKRIPTLDL